MEKLHKFSACFFVATENELLKKKQTEGKEKSHNSFIFGLASTLGVPMHCSMRHRNLLNLFVVCGIPCS